MITLIKDTVSNEDIDNLSDWLKTYPRLTKGPMTTQFESKFSDWEGVNHSVMVNSGSSANLLMLYTLKVMGKMKNDKVVVPGLTWATDLAPVIQLGMEPLLCDCNLTNLSVDIGDLERIFEEHEPSVLILVSILGFSPNMDAITALCNTHGVILLEDVCESLGTTYKGKKLGTFGLMSSYSFYFGHHASTIEGGMVCTNDEEVYKVLLSIRSHGWNRDWSIEDRESIEEQYGIDNINAMYTFYYPGFNLRATDLQAFIGLEQMPRFDDGILARYNNFNTYNNLIQNPYWMPSAIPDSMTSNFAYPLIHPKKDVIVNILWNNDIETRPLVCGSMGTQPFYTNLYGELRLENCDIVSDYGIYLPNHPALNYSEIEKVCEVINKVIGE